MNAEGTGLTVGPGSTVLLINGAQACNVFWKVDTASINTSAVFKGNILALNSISVANGANIEGRLLARNGAVTLDQSTITVAKCALVSVNTNNPAVAAGIASLPTSGKGPDKSESFWNIVILSVVVAASLSLAMSQRNSKQIINNINK